ncbi:hypothetical protein [Nonomuraea roseoviolacea]|uniref:Alkylation response protein AidB-like acyl-CoA dehydrogenase n=1 Tax=Nonomuraea roseoviolacea subsp. carminata TaxID=160689 RepID=A0ABT1KDC9_9ACTN|nr:hypothetical protein [Nonomuraea roseoviolacea]MCP2350974.1 alkylation response protein AidB-like acyl-CoA dehydrogenase [Nonomuraea roseoviolacea subsp. carminata]
MTVERALPTPGAHDLIRPTREPVAREVAPRAAADEAAGRFPREAKAPRLVEGANQIRRLVMGRALAQERL